ncbi:hypothetical protein M3Y94_01064700 [Aphelenchoides besseyi]|nr:hypothetical protein M3Y94_01064700 [Aphelenchoides besseyi]
MTSDLCLICSQPATGYHFSIPACNACCAFFRRSCTQARSYKCSRSNNCDVTAIKGSTRSVCRGCRLAKALKMGMKSEMVQNAHNSIRQKGQESWLNDSDGQNNRQLSIDLCVNSGASFLEQESQISTNTIAPIMSSQSNLVSNLNRGAHDYTRQQRFLFNLLYPDRDPEKLYYVRYNEYMRMKAASVSLMHNVLTDFFPAFAELNPNFKSSFTQSFFHYFSPLWETYQTFCHFPNDSKSYYVLNYGQLLNCSRMDLFYAEDPNPIESVRQTEEVSIRFGMLTEKMMQMKVRDVEIAGLLGIMLWNRIALESTEMKDVADEQRSRVFASLYSEMCQFSHTPELGPRLGNLIMMLNDIEKNC